MRITVFLFFSLGQPCDAFRPFVGGDHFRECCDCCSLGIKAKDDPYASCSTAKFPEPMSNNLSFPCVQAFHECCSGKKNAHLWALLLLWLTYLASLQENNLSNSCVYTVLHTRLSNRKIDIFFTGKVKIPTVIPTIPSRKPKCSDNFCGQECQDSPTEGAQCSCRDGYLLQPDRVSCRGLLLLFLFLDVLVGT